MNFKNLYYNTISIIDSWVDGLNDNYFVKDENSKMYGLGASFDMLYDVSPELGNISNCVTAYCCCDSKYYRNKNLLDFISRNLRSLRRKFNDDGTNTMYQSNFHTAEQFGLVSIATSLSMFSKKLTDDEYENRVFDEMCDMVSFVCLGCLNGGFHTPNHRWVESAGLLLAYNILVNTKHNELVKQIYEKAQKYLAEGVDCDSYGEWSERSAGMYNLHCDNAFLDIYYVLKKDEYLDCVYRNLDLMTHYINDSDISIFTQNSRRNDKGELGSVPTFNKGRTFYADHYLTPYAITGFLKNDNRYASIAYIISQKTSMAGRMVYFPISCFILYPELLDWEFDYIENPLPKTYEHYLPNSNIVRKKTENATYSFLANNPAFLQIDAPGIQMKMRMCSSFFAIAQFVPKKMEKTEKGYLLSYEAHAEYKLPLENPDSEQTKNYWTIDYSKRKSIQELDYKMSVELIFDNDDLLLKFSVNGCDKVPTKIEMFFNEGLHCEIGDAVVVTKAGGNAFSKGEKVRIESERKTIMEISNLCCKHLYTDMRGSLDPIGGAFALYATDFAPFEKEIHIKISKANETRVFY